jgi:predicted ester cyclase
MAWLRAFPDARIDVARQIAGGATVVQEFTFTGTHDASLAAPGGETVPPTHRRLDGRGVQILDFEDGRVRHAELYFDQAQVMAQLGIGAAAAV